MLPIDRSPLAAAASNQVPYAVASSSKNINAMTNAYNTIDELNAKIDAHASSALLPHADASVTGAKLAPQAVTNDKVAGKTLTADKFVDGALTNDTQNGLRITALQADIAQWRISVKTYGAMGDGTDETTKIQNTINAVISANTKLVFFPQGTYSATTLTGLDKVNVVGNNASLTVGGVQQVVQQVGSQSGSNVYSNAVADTNNIPANSLDHARNAIVTKKALRIAIWADSISEGYDQTNPEDAYAKKIERAITNALPNINVTVFNFSLAGYGIYPINSTDILPNGTSLWAVSNKSWHDYVKDFNPDLVIIAFGMNDSGAGEENTSNSLTTIVADMKNWNSNPSVVLVPTILPTKDLSRYGQGQKETLRISRATREFAKANGIICADAGRMFQILRDGLDDVSRVSTQEVNWANYNSLWSGDKSSYVLGGTTLTPVPGSSTKFVTRARDFYNGYIEFNVVPITNGATDIPAIHYREDATLGKMTILIKAGATTNTGYVEIYSSDSGSYLATATGLAIKAGVSTKVKIEVLGIKHNIYINDVQVLTYTTYKKLHNGNVSLGAFGLNSPFSNLVISYLDPIKTTPYLTEDDLLGKYNSAESGNGINHPSGLGHAMAYVPAFNGLIKGLTQPIETAMTDLQRQMIINGNFDRWDRGLSIATSSGFIANKWGFDKDATTSVITLSRQTLTPGDIANSYYYCRINISGLGSGYTTTSFARLSQKVENGTRLLAGVGKKITISFWARTSIAGKRIGFFLEQNYGSGGSPTASEQIGGSNITLTSTWTRYTHTFNLNTLVGKTFGTNDDDFLHIQVWQMWGSFFNPVMGSSSAETFSGAGNIEIAEVQVNSGDLDLSYQPRSVDDEIMKSLRFAWIPQTSSVFARLTTYTANTLVFDVSLPVQLRTLPTIRGAVNTDIVVNTVAGVAQTGFTASAILTSNGVRVTMTKTAHGLTDAVLEIKTSSGFEAEL